jgi:hypothetical protein
MIDAVLSALKYILNIVNKTFLLFVPQNFNNHPTLMKLSRGQCCHITEYLLARAGTQKTISKILKIDSPRNKNCYCLRIKPFVNQK